MHTPHPPKVQKTRRRRALKTQLDIKRALAWIFGELEADRMTEAKARTLANIGNILSYVHERTELEAGLEAVKKTLEDAGHGVKQ